MTHFRKTRDASPNLLLPCLQHSQGSHGSQNKDKSSHCDPRPVTHKVRAAWPSGVGSHLAVPCTLSPPIGPLHTLSPSMWSSTPVCPLGLQPLPSRGTSPKCPLGRCPVGKMPPGWDSFSSHLPAVCLWGGLLHLSLSSNKGRNHTVDFLLNSTESFWGRTCLT